MKTIANFHFANDGSLSVNFSSEKWVNLFKEKLELDVKNTPRVFFVTKIVPAFVFCGASIIVTTHANHANGRKMFSYEIHVDDENAFLRSIEMLVDEVCLSDSKAKKF